MAEPEHWFGLKRLDDWFERLPPGNQYLFLVYITWGVIFALLFLGALVLAVIGGKL